MILRTERLELTVLDAEMLRLWTRDLPGLERALRCSYRAEPMEGRMLAIAEGQLPAVEKDPELAPWHSFWLLIRAEDRTVVGSADFKNFPDQNGETELGYGLGEPFLHRGYMTEAVRGMCRWAFGQPGVLAVTAETEKDNLPSQRVLLRCGFAPFRRGEALWWRLPAPRGSGHSVQNSADNFDRDLR